MRNDPQPESGAELEHALDGVISKDMPYSQFRKAVIDRGWSPVQDASCKRNVVGEGYEQLCRDNPQLALCKACDEIPELSSCSGDGHCVMQFSHAGFPRVLRVASYGEISDWNAPADDSGLGVVSWEYVEREPR